MRIYLLIAAIAGGVTWLVTPLIRHVAIHIGAVGEVRARDVHTIPTPRMGGLGMLIGFAFAMIYSSRIAFTTGLFENNNQEWVILAGAVLICLLGMADDLWDLDWMLKMAGQLLISVFVAWGGLQIISLPLGSLITASPSISVTITAILIVASINAVNFVDGLDGLAAGIVAIGGVAFATALIIVSYLHVVFGEMVPKNLAFSLPDRAVLLLATPLVWVSKLFYPIIVALNWIANHIVRLFRVEPKNEASSTFTLDEVATIVAQSRMEGVLDDAAVDFLTSRNVSIGLSLDGPLSAVTDATRLTWGGKSVHDKVLTAMEKLRGYGSWSVITTCTTENLPYLTRMVELFHAREVPTCMLNTLRCTLPGARGVKPADGDMAKAFFAALDRTHELYRQTGRKLLVANFANVLIAILAPTARRLMCDISPCGGGRAFFALAADGSLYPCSEFIGLPRFNGGKLLENGGIEAALKSDAFNIVTARNVDTFAPCSDCAIRHFCGSPCPAEAHEMNGGMNQIGAFCEFYKEQVNYALCLIADGKANDYLWDGWDEGTETTFML